jgi:hypothetical protein
MTCPSCGNPNKIYCKGLCSNCYKKQKRDARPKIPCACGCGTMIPSISRDGKPNRYAYGHNFGTKENNPNYKGGQFLTTKGYRMIYSPNHPYATKMGYVMEHRLNMEARLRERFGLEEYYIPPDVYVHHKDENKLNNHWSNLQLITGPKHTLLHKKKDLSDRKCADPACITPYETQLGMDGNPCWFRGEDDKTWYCKRCYSRNKKRLKK